MAATHEPIQMLLQRRGLLMNASTHHPLASIPKRLVIGIVILIAFVMLGIAVSHAGEIASTECCGHGQELAAPPAAAYHS